ncbi:MAG: hypothetical protein LJE70_09780 [Chromatiaceae bacterium]|nr:hypothetical protein [Chromatiaceae bacterium]
MFVPQEELFPLEQLVVESADLFQELPYDGDTIMDRATLERFADIVERCRVAAGKIGLLGLQEAYRHLSDCVTSLGQKDGRDASTERRLLAEWTGLFSDYLSSLYYLDSSPGVASALLRYLQKSYWENPLPQEYIELLHELLVLPLADSTTDFLIDGAKSVQPYVENIAEHKGDGPSSRTRVEKPDRDDTVSADPDILRLLH